MAKRKADELLSSASTIINGDRQDDYGSARDSFKAVSEMWTAFVGTDITPPQVAIMLALLKAVRLRNGPHKDSFLDAAAYMALAYEVSEEE